MINAYIKKYPDFVVLRNDIYKLLTKGETYLDDNVYIHNTKVELLENKTDIEYLATRHYKYYDWIIVMKQNENLLAVFSDDGSMIYSNVKF
jgi:hypothetical protein